MKIAIVSGDDGVGGDYAGRLSGALAAQGQTVTAYVRQSGRPGRRGARNNARQAYRTVPMSVGADAEAPDRDALPFIGEWASTLERQWSSDRPDIVHAQGWLGGLAAQLAARRRRLPTVQSFYGLAATSHSPDSRSDGGGGTERERIEPLLARNATWVTGESAAEVELLAKLRHGRSRLSVLAGGVDVERYTPVGPALARSELHRVLCLARNPLPYNGFDLVIRAMSRAAGTELVVAETDGTNARHDEARSELKDLAAQLGVADRVRLAGHVVSDQLPRLLRSADVVACTPRRPPRATTVLQAMASGVAVITLPVGVLSDVVVHAVTGLVLPPNNPAELVAALRSLPAQTFQCQSLGAAGRNRVLARFTWDRMALESLNIYKRLASPYLQPAAAQVS